LQVWFYRRPPSAQALWNSRRIWLVPTLAGHACPGCGDHPLPASRVLSLNPAKIRLSPESREAQIESTRGRKPLVASQTHFLSQSPTSLAHRIRQESLMAQLISNDDARECGDGPDLTSD